MIKIIQTIFECHISLLTRDESSWPQLKPDIALQTLSVLSRKEMNFS